MDKFKRVMLRLMYPNGIWTLVITVLASGLLIYCFTAESQESVLSYVAYVFSAYALIVLIAGFPNLMIRRRKIVKKIEALVSRNKYGDRYINDTEFRVRISLHQGLFVNLLFAAFKLATSFIYASFWFGAVGVYYVILSVIRFMLLRSVRKISSKENESERFAHGLRTYRFCGSLMLILNSAMTGMVFQMIWQNQGYHYPGMIIYVSATYAFYCMITAIFNMVKYRKMDKPVLSAAKMLSFAGALMSMLALQTAMITQFGGGDEDFRQLMNTAFGGSVCLIVFGMAVFMIVRANKVIAKLQINNSGTQ